jgi:hypothetical protein
MMGIESTVAASDTAPLSATNRSRAVSDHRVFSGVGRRARRRVGQSRRTTLVRVLHPAPSQIGPRSPLPCVQGTHERNGGKPEYYDALHLSGDPTPEYQLRATRPRPRRGPEWRLRHGLPAGLWSAADVRTAGDLAGPESAARIRQRPHDAAQRVHSRSLAVARQVSGTGLAGRGGAPVSVASCERVKNFSIKTSRLAAHSAQRSTTPESTACSSVTFSTVRLPAG